MAQIVRGEKKQKFTKLSFTAGSSSSLASLARRGVEGEQENNRCMQMITNCIVRMISKQAKALFYSPLSVTRRREPLKRRQWALVVAKFALQRL